MAETEETRKQWSQLPKDALTMIAKHLRSKTATGSVTATSVDTLRLRSVCKSWRSSITPFKPTQTPSLPTINLPFPIAPNPALNPDRRCHFSLSQSTIYFLESPPLPPPPPPSSSSLTNNNRNLPWLLRVEEVAAAGNGSSKWHPLNPLSRILTERFPKAFPKSLNLLNFRISEIGKAYSIEFVDRSNKEIAGYEFPELKSILVKKVVVSSGPWGVAGSSAGINDFAVMAIHGGKLGFFKLGDKRWSQIDDYMYDDVAYHRGNFYAVDLRGRAVSIGSDLKAKGVASQLPGRGGGQFKYLVKSGDDLYLIDKYLDAEQEILWNDVEVFDLDTPVQLKVYKLNEAIGQWERVDDLNELVFFVGDDCSYSVHARDFPGLLGNCIYFSEDMFSNEEEENLGELCSDTGVYKLEDGSCGPLALFPDHWPIFWPPPAWLKPKPGASKK